MANIKLQDGRKTDLLLGEISQIVQELVEIYNTTDNLADQQYIFAKLKGILLEIDSQDHTQIHGLIFQAIREIACPSERIVNS